ncbi:hypothetical protein C900_04698 [Fulvivirga imtechensis AK7]|uniref:Alkyl hydroperoxide reductase subunit C/ Thiol specific antioxidant domain-containing protein n=1 Tax=Fulvivirga imtechensis AK7 TaxID=1237149 RepID=L8JLA6_9BACT|nr:redoxin domain-containing protein [Fulvivirga imtechensis]ELR69721.1 hypothetical protein C900_04698 [Fulvivirga imtechensis AK7]
MKKKAILTLAFLLLLTIGWVGFKGIRRLNKKAAIEKKQGDLSLMLNQINQADTDITPTTILIFFNSECEHCQEEIKEVSKNIGELKKYQLFLISYEPENEALAFLSRYNLSNFYLKSSPEKVISAFEGSVPQTLIYKKGKLIQHFKGEVKIETILDLL